jgi:hypothetical protein
MILGTNVQEMSLPENLSYAQSDIGQTKNGNPKPHEISRLPLK